MSNTNTKLTVTIEGISEELNSHISNLLICDQYKSTNKHLDDKDILEKGEIAEQYLIEKGIVDEDEQFVKPELLEGEFKIAAQWLKDNI